jgi:hypothetical protein
MFRAADIARSTRLATALAVMAQFVAALTLAWVAETSVDVGRRGATKGVGGAAVRALVVEVRVGCVC